MLTAILTKISYNILQEFTHNVNSNFHIRLTLILTFGYSNFNIMLKAILKLD